MPDPHGPSHAPLAADDSDSKIQGQLVHVIDDDAAARNSLAFLLECHGISTRTYESGSQFIKLIEVIEPACIITDIRMPGLGGLELVAELRARGIIDPVIVITGHADVPLAIEAMHAGVSDFIEKPFSDEAMLTAIRSVLAKRRNADEIDIERQRIVAKLGTLSGRESEVMDGLLDGKANKVIAYDLGISARTVEVYRANVMNKTGARTLSELVRMVTLARLSR